MVDKERPQSETPPVAPTDVWLARNTRYAPAFGHGGASNPPDEQHPANKRISIRREVSCNVLVNFSMGYAVAHRIHNLSLGGALVEMDINGIQVGDPVEIVLEFSRDGRVAERRIPAQVTRTGRNCVALKFGRYDNRTYTDLVNFLYTG